jgi:hypothetical protein
MARHSGARPGLDTGSDGLRVGRRIALILLVGSVTAFAALLGAPSTGPVLLARDLVLFNVAHLATAALCWWPRAVSDRARRAWRLLAVAVVLSVAGNVCFTLVSEVGATTSDVLYLAAYPAINVAAILLIRERGRHIVPAVWLDGLVIGLSVAAMAAALVLAPLLRLAPPTPVTNLAYPVADLTLLIVLATVGGATGLRLDPRLALLGSGLALTFLTDVAYLLANLSRSYHEGAPLDLGWLLALLPIAAAAALRGPHHRPAGTLPTAPIQRAAVAAPTAAALAALAVLVVGYYVDLPPAAGALAGAALLVALLRACLTLQQLKAARGPPPGAHRPTHRPGQPQAPPRAMRPPAHPPGRFAGHLDDDRPRRFQGHQRPARAPRGRRAPGRGRHPPVGDHAPRRPAGQARR